MTTTQEQVPEVTGRPHLRVVSPDTDGDPALGTRYSALPDRESVGVTPTRSLRARARGGAEQDRLPGAQSDGAGQVESIDQAPVDVVEEPGAVSSAAGRARARLGRGFAAVRAVAESRCRDRAAWVRLGRVFIPPKLITERRPSLKEQWYYAHGGEHLPERGVWRFLAMAYAVLVSLPTSCLAYVYEWVWERPTRALAAFVLAGVLTQVPYVVPVARFIATVATYPVTFWF